MLSGGSADDDVKSNGPLRPGDPVGVSLLGGDGEMGATGTVTHVDGDRVYAFGQPFYGLRPTQFPMTRAYIHTVLPSLNSSQKIASTGDIIGTVSQDRATAIAGTLGAGPAMIPITLTLNSERGTRKSFTFGMVNDQLLTPLGAGHPWPGHSMRLTRRHPCSSALPALLPVVSASTVPAEPTSACRDGTAGEPGDPPSCVPGQPSHRGSDARHRHSDTTVPDRSAMQRAAPGPLPDDRRSAE